MRKLLLLLALIAPLAVAEPPVPMKGVAHVAIRVADVPASRAFYEKLGFEQAFILENKGVLDRSFIKFNDEQFMELYPVNEKTPKVEFLHLCFYGDQLQALHDQYVSEGLTPIAVRKAGAGNLLFTMEGPEKQNIEYTQYMPGSLHTNDNGKHLGANRISDRLIGVSLAMKDVPSARAFYSQKLRLATAKSGSYIVGDQRVVIEDDQIGSRMHAFFLVKDLKLAATELKRRGVEFKAGKKALTVTDPDGNLLDFVAEAP